MQVSIHGHSMNVSQRLEKYVKAKTERLERYLPGVEEVRVLFARQSAKPGAPKIVEMTLKRKRTTLRAEEREADAFKAFDKTLDNMLHRIARLKSRRIDKKRSGKGGAVVEVEEDGLEHAEPLPVEAPDAVPAPKLVRIKTFAVTPMSVEEAIDHMELVSHDFYVFVHDEDDGVKVVYRRKEGGYGLLQPGK
jgi:putative sigma-54 modulation protein